MSVCLSASGDREGNSGEHERTISDKGKQYYGVRSEMLPLLPELLLLAG